MPSQSASSSTRASLARPCWGGGSEINSQNVIHDASDGISFGLWDDTHGERYGVPGDGHIQFLICLDKVFIVYEPR